MGAIGGFAQIASLMSCGKGYVSECAQLNPAVGPDS